MTKIFFSLFILIMCSSKSYGAKGNDNFKPGYIITRGNDSIPGFILIRDHVFNTINCVFKSSADGATKTYSPVELIAYGVGKEKYFFSHSLDLEDSPKNIFLECLVRGKTSLFFYQDRYFLKTPTKFEELIIQTKTSTRDGKTYNIKLALYKSTLQQELGDCSTINEQLQKTTLSEKSLRELFSKYYACTAEQAVFFENEPEKVSVSYEIVPGVFFSQLIFSADASVILALERMTNSTSTGFTPSFWFIFSSSRHSLRLRTGFTYYSANYRSYYDYTLAGLGYESTSSCSRLEIPIQLKYHLLRNNKSFYVVGGIGVNKMLTWENKYVTRDLSNNNVLETLSFNNRSIFINFLGGVGYEIPLGNHAISLEATYGIAPGVLEPKSLSPGAKINSFVISTGFIF